MTEQQFIDYIGPKATLDHQKHGILASITIAQACLESGYGTTELAINANNLFGMKTILSGNTWYSVWDGTSKYTKQTKEEYEKGHITTITADFRKYSNIDLSIEDHSLYLTQAKNGNKLRYAGLAGESNYRTAAQLIKNGGYATDSQYVNKLCNIIEKWNLTKYDKKGDIKVGYTNSSLVTYTKLSPNHSGTRTHSIDRITPHCVVGQLTASGIASCFTSPSREASCNYGIGTNGDVALIVEEKNRSWCSSSNENDQRAVTIECASDKTEPYAFNTKVYNKLIDLCVDICKRNGKNKLIWFGDKNKTLNYNPKSNEMVLTVHRWFANKSCPGNWMYNRMDDLANTVTSKLGGSNKSTTSSTSNTSKTSNTKFPATPFTVDVIVNDLNYRSQPSMNGTVKGQTGKGKFTITEVKDGWGKLKSNVGWIYLENTSYVKIGKTIATSVNKSTSTNKTYKIKVTTDALNIRAGAGVKYKITGCIRDRGTYTIVETKNGFGKLKSGAGWICLDYTKKV